MRLPPLAACLLLMLALAPGTAWARGTIDKVVITGLDADEALRENVRLVVGLDSVIGKEQGESRLDYLMTRAERDTRLALEPFGYYSPTVTVNEQRDGNDHIVVTIHVEKGEAVRVRSSHVALIGPAEDDQYLQHDLAAFKPVPGDVFDHSVYELHKDGITHRLAERGYFDADFASREVRVTRASRTADIDLVWDSGFRYDMGPTTFHQDYFDPGLLDRLVNWEAGSYFHQGKLDRLQESLVKLDYFSAIDIQTHPEQAGDDLQVPIDVHLTLAKRNIYSAGLSYGTESGPGVRLGLERRYVNSKGHKLNYDLDWASNRKSFITQYRVPGFAWLDGWYAFAFSAYDEQTDYIDLRNIKLIASRSGVINDRWTAIASVNGLRERWSYDMDTATGERLYTYSTLFYPELNGTYIGIDDKLFPRRGVNAQVFMRAGAEALGSDTNFVQLSVRGYWYHGIGESNRLIVRGEAGTTWTSELVAMPPSLRFFAGGDASVRGYAWREVGPRTAPPDNFAMGAKNVLTGSLEFEHYLDNSPWGGAVFVDAGDAFDDTGSIDIHVGVGIGVRWRSPVGPVRVDIARGLDDPDSPFQLYLNIGVGL